MSEHFDENYKRCIRELRCFLVMPPSSMESQAEKIKQKAQLTLNNGRKGSGLKGSKMRCFSEVYNLARKYRNGSISYAKHLSTYERMANRLNQHNEGGNCFRNMVGREIVRQGANPTLDSWCKQQQILENETVGRYAEVIKKGKPFKKKNSTCVTLDNILLHLVK